MNWWLKPENSDELKSILLRHLLPNIYTSETIPEVMEVKTCNGDMIKTERLESEIVIKSWGGNTGKIVATNMFASNGIIHMIDNVLWLNRKENLLPQGTLFIPCINISTKAYH